MSSVNITGVGEVKTNVGNNYVGKSAYQIAVEAGYTGTYEEFATLQSESGNNAVKAENAKTDAEAAAKLAKEVAESIPEDYSTLSDNVEDLMKDHFLKLDTDGRVYYEE